MERQYREFGIDISQNRQNSTVYLNKDYNHDRISRF